MRGLACNRFLELFSSILPVAVESEHVPSLLRAVAVDEIQDDPLLVARGTRRPARRMHKQSYVPTHTLLTLETGNFAWNL
ncbi:hypothetical protein C8R47DRAFT_1101145 [Mycena vitilis]|nr:hypothetical protein C8R47DRAFT_1101145 [Mycena vitilis]